MTDPHFEEEQGGPKRDRYGRYLLPDPETGAEMAWTRVTTVAPILSDRYNLEKWAQRMTALGLAKREDLLALVKATARIADTRNGKSTLNRVVSDAIEAGNVEQRANLGTAIHAATEAYDRGEPYDLPKPYDKDVKAYAKKMKELGLSVVPGWIERILVNPECGVAGTCDRAVMRKGWKLPRIADVKTGKSVHFSELEHSIQQAMYANATHYWDAERGELVPCPPLDKKSALIIHLPAGKATCEVHELDIEAGYEAAMLAVEVKEWRGRRGLSRPFVPEDAAPTRAARKGKA